jgi:GxxExxY protein
VAVRVMYKGEEIGHQRLDMIVDGVVVVEIKSTPALAPVARRQLFAYLRATNLEVGLLLHFGPDARFFRSLSLNAPTPARPSG